MLVVPMGCTEVESTRGWVVSLTNMTLNKVVLPVGASVYQDAKGQPMPPQRWPTEFHYVDGGLEQADTTDFVCVNRIIAEPWQQCFAVSPVDIGESEDLLTEEELDLVQGYMDQPFHDWGNQREGKGQDKAWWEVDSIVSGSYDGNTFVKRVLDHMSSQDAFPWGAWPRDAALDTHKQAGRQSTALTGASSRSCHVTKRFRILATLKQGIESMYSNTS